MRIKRLVKPLALMLIFLSSSCSSLSNMVTYPQGPTPIPVHSPTPLPAAEVIFNVIPPEGTPVDADLAMVLLDEVTGLTYNTYTIPMTRLADGGWQARLTPPLGSLLRYRYIRRAPIPADDVTASGAPIPYRISHIPGPTQIDDLVAAWSGTLYSGPIGRITGRIRDTHSGNVLPEILVSAAGLTTFTDGEGSFRLDGLPPGLHNLVIFSPDGAYQTAQQGAVVAAESMTPVELGLLPAKTVQVAFQVTVPADTIPGIPVRIAGNVLQLGNVFSELTGGLRVSISHMPTLTLVDPTHYLAVVTLYAGTDLRYKYTLGDGLWNAERDSKGFFLTRQVIIPDYDLVVNDSISTWHGGEKGSLSFYLKVPENTPSSDHISLQFNPFDWFEPLPMWSLGENEWFYTLHGPLDFSGELGYRYCRNMQCGSADDAETAGPNAVGRLVTPSQDPQNLIDEVSAWQWWDPTLPATTVIAPEIIPRADFEVGVAFLPAYQPNWIILNNKVMTAVADIGANAIILSPTWMLKQNNRTPILAFDPAFAPFRDDLRVITDDALGNDLQVAFRPSLLTSDGHLETWWTEAIRDSAWWAVWFEEYRSFILTYARQAQEAGANKLILGGPEIAPSLPGGQLPDGTPSNAPQDAESHWRSLIKEVRGLFLGQLAFEIELGQSLQPPPPFLEALDEVHIYWHAPLASGDEPSIPEMQIIAGNLLDDAVLSNPKLAGMPIVLSIEYLSVVGSATACAKAPDGSCRLSSTFDQGAMVDQDLELDLTGQAEAINAVLLEAYTRPAVKGFYLRGYNPTVALPDKSASVNGKPACDVLRYWYPYITGRQ